MESLKTFFISLYNGMHNCSSNLFGFDLSLWDIFITGALMSLAGFIIWGFFGRE